SVLGLTKITRSIATYIRDPYGTLISQQGTSGGLYHYVKGRTARRMALLTPIGTPTASLPRATSTAPQATRSRRRAVPWRQTPPSRTLAPSVTRRRNPIGWTAISSTSTR